MGFFSCHSLPAAPQVVLNQLVFLRSSRQLEPLALADDNIQGSALITYVLVHTKLHSEPLSGSENLQFLQKLFGTYILLKFVQATHVPLTVKDLWH